MATVSMTPTAQLTPDSDAVVAEIFVAAPPARVFDAIADPNQRARWWGLKRSEPDVNSFRVTDATSDLRVGGKWSNEGVTGDGKRFHLEGEYLEIDPPRLLVHTRVADFAGNFNTIVRWELEARDVHGLHVGGAHRVGTGTLLKVRHSGFAGHIDQAQGHRKGWEASLGWLRSFIEKGGTVDSRP
jgi:uncharacterized protein YndB with AHSA1/START domain